MGKLIKFFTIFKRDKECLSCADYFHRLTETYSIIRSLDRKVKRLQRKSAQSIIELNVLKKRYEKLKLDRENRLVTIKNLREKLRRVCK